LEKMFGIWAPYHRTGRTTITLALAFKILERLAGDKKVLICCTNGSRGTLLKSAGIHSEEVGLHDLASYKQAGFYIGEYSNILPKKGRLFFAGSNKMTPHFIKSHSKFYEELFEELKNQFDFILIDMPDGYDGLIINMLKDKCRFITVLDQDADRIKEVEQYTSDIEEILVVNKYKNLYPNKSDIKALYPHKGEIFCTPDCNILRGMQNKGRISQYCTMETDFNFAVENIVTYIIGESISLIREKPAEVIGKGLLSRLKTSMLGGEHG